VYKVDIVVKGFEPRFVREASTAIRDLLLVNFAPKGRSAVGQGPPPASMPHVNLELPFGEIKLKTLKTIYTVIRGPHVHKTSREQFAKITHRRRITHHTNNHSELQWFLDCLKLYEFHGVEIIVDVVTSSYMQPTTTADLDASQRPLLADHMQQFQQYFAPSPPATSSSSSSSSAAAASGYRADLQQLQAAVLEGLDELRYQLQGKQGYASWSWVQSSSSSVGTGDEAAPSAPPPSAAGAAAGVVEQLDQQLLSSTLAAGTSSSSGALQDAAAAAAQKVLQRLSPDKLTRWVGVG
jgi:ribosomal protein S10